MTFLLITGLFILITLLILSFLIIGIQSNKIQTYENWILEFKNEIQTTYDTIIEIDKKGVFSTSLNKDGIFQYDDEVGVIFKQMKDLIEKLNQRTQ